MQVAAESAIPGERSERAGPSILGLVGVGVGIALAFTALFLPKLAVDTHLHGTGLDYGDVGTVVPLTVNSMFRTGTGGLIILCGLVAAVGFWHHYASHTRVWAPLPAGAGLIAIAIYQSTGDRLNVEANPDSYWRFAQGSPSFGVYVTGAAGVLLLLGGIACVRVAKTERALDRLLEP